MRGTSKERRRNIILSSAQVAFLLAVLKIIAYFAVVFGSYMSNRANLVYDYMAMFMDYGTSSRSNDGRCG